MEQVLRTRLADREAHSLALAEQVTTGVARVRELESALASAQATLTSQREVATELRAHLIRLQREQQEPG